MCGKMIEGNVVGYPCSLTANHDGPCMAEENVRSVRERKKWELEQQALADAKTPQQILGETQGPAQTTAEGYHDGATPVPGSEAGSLTETVVEVPPEENLRRTTSEDFVAAIVDPEDEDAVQDRIISKVQLLVDRGDLDPEAAAGIKAQIDATRPRPEYSRDTLAEIVILALEEFSKESGLTAENIAYISVDAVAEALQINLV